MIYVFLAFLSCFSSFCAAQTISSITVNTSRVSPAVVRKAAGLREGSAATSEALDGARRRLYGLNLFRTLEISTASAAGGGTEVRINGRDGWYFLPLPFYRSGSGGRSLSLMLMERNFFRQAESAYLMRFSNDESSRWMAGFSLPEFSVNSVLHRESGITERMYGDGGFNVTNFMRSSKNEKDPGRLGTVVRTYPRRISGGNVTVSSKISRALTASVLAETNAVAYGGSTAFDPGDSGKQNFMEFRLSMTPGGNHERMADVFGSIFGLGLADMEERLRPFYGLRLRHGPELALLCAGRGLGSDYAFSRITAGYAASMELPGRDLVFVRARA
ncbi:MAG: hypothetical protein ABIG11_01175, partial [bacterium]